MKRFDKGYIFHHLITDFFVIFFLEAAYLSNLLDDEEGEAMAFSNFIVVFAVVFVVIYLLKTLYSILYVKTSGYALGDNSIECNRGVFFKKHSVVDYVKMHAINKRQSFIQKWFKIATLTIDSGSANTSSRAEILIVEREDVVDKLVTLLRAKQRGEDVSDTAQEEVDDRVNLYDFTKRRKIVYSALSLLSALFGIVIATVMAVVVGSFLLKFAVSISGNILLDILLITLLVYLGVSVLSFVTGILVSFLSYHNFTVYKSEGELEISYGFFVRSTNTIKLFRIKALKVQSGFVKRLFGFATVMLEVIGYGDSGSESSTGSKNSRNNGVGILFPLVAINELVDTLAPILPEYTPNEVVDKPKYYAPFVLWRAFFICVFTLLPLGIALFDMVYLGVATSTVLTVLGVSLCEILVIVLLMLWDRWYSYRNSGISIEGEILTIVAGGFTRDTTVIKRANVVAIEKWTTPLRKKKGIYSYTIHVHTNAQTNEVKVLNLDKSVGDRLEQFLII